MYLFRVSYLSYMLRVIFMVIIEINCIPKGNTSFYNKVYFIYLFVSLVAP